MANPIGNSITPVYVDAHGKAIPCDTNVIWVPRTVICYISPTGSDSNFVTQLSRYGQSDQVNYPLFSLEKACEFLGHFRAYGPYSHTYEIWCEDGTYNYTTRQNLFHPACSCVGTFILIRPRTSLIIGQTPKVVFKNISGRDRNVNDAVITAYSNVSIHMCHITSLNKLSYGFYDHRITRVQIYGCEFSNFVRACDCRASWSHVGSWYNSSDPGTLDNIWSKQTPIYIHDCDIGIVAEGGIVDLGGFIRVNTASHGFISARHATMDVSDWRPLRIDTKTPVAPFTAWSGGWFEIYLNDRVYPTAINTYRPGMTMTSAQDAFGILINKDPTVNGVIVFSDPTNIVQTGLNNNMFG